MTENRDYGKKTIDYDDFHSCSDEYKKFIVRIMSMQAYAENCGTTEVGSQLHIAPTSSLRLAVAKIVYDEARHANMLYNILAKIGISEQQAVETAVEKTKKSKSLHGVEVVGDKNNTWLDIILNNMLLDRAGGFMVRNFAQSSFKPWADACDSIAEDEEWHQRFGLIHVLEYIKTFGIDAVQDKFLFWYVNALNFFGPPNNQSEGILKSYGIKRQSNQELRQAYIQHVEQLLKEHKLESLIVNITNEYPYQVTKEFVHE